MAIELHPFFTHIRKQHPDPNKFSDFLSACQRPLRKSLRVNTLKISVADFRLLAEKRSWQLEPIPWCEQGFWIDDSSTIESFQLGNAGEHLQGLFYIQEASSMLPPIALFKDNVSASPVLDMAAAPGSKTTQLAAMMNNRGTVLANELSASRLKVLHANLERCGVINTCLSHLDGIQLDKALSGYFEAILLDAPCGGEGTYRKDQKALDNWSLQAIDSISTIQKRLIKSAWRMLKPGGRLVYSTCTLSRGENQHVIQALQDEFSSEINIISLTNLFEGAGKSLTKEGFLHVWPETFDSEGFFVACLEKNITTKQITTGYKLSGQSPFKALLSKTLQLVLDYYLEHFGFDLSPFQVRLRLRISQREQQIWLFPDDAEPLREVMKLQRSGIRVCDLLENRKGTLVKTRNEFVKCFGAKFISQIISLSSSEAIHWTKGDNISQIDMQDINKGEVVTLHRGTPLGLAKVIINGKKIKLKNNMSRDLLRSNANFHS